MTAIPATGRSGGGLGMLCFVFMAAIAVAALVAQAANTPALMDTAQGSYAASAAQSRAHMVTTALPNVEWSDHAKTSHTDAYLAVAEWIAAHNPCDFRQCPDGTWLLICWDLGGVGKHGFAPVAKNGSGNWSVVGKTAYWATQDEIVKILDKHLCRDELGHPELLPFIEFGERDE